MNLSTPGIALALIFIGCLIAISAGSADASDLPAHVRGEILLKLSDPDSRMLKESFVGSFGGMIEREDRTLGYSRVKLPDHMTVEQAIESLSGDPRVAWVEPNYYGWLYGAPQDPHIVEDTEPSAPLGPSAWHLFQTNLFHLWRWAGGGGPSVSIGIIDSGSDLTHADLAGNAALSGHKDFVDGDTNPNDPHGHGTHVTGIACALSNAVGMAGVAYDAEFVSIRVFDAGGSTTVDRLTQGILWAADSTSVSVINMSLGITPNNPVYDAIAHALVKGIIPVAASGNDTSSTVAFPANIPGVISVGSVKYDTTVAVSSNYDSTLNCVAPGVGIWSTKSGGGYEYRSGTSMAAPFVAGVCAILKNKYSALTAVDMEEYISTIAVDLPGIKDGDGVIHFTPLEDWMDAPAAPLARHKNFAYEWLGTIATGETDPNDPADTDGQENVYLGMYDRDGGDDGVFPASLGDLPYLPTYIDPMGEKVSVKMSVSDHTGPRYGAGSDLHLDVWVDWDTDYAFGGAGEHVVVDHTEDPSTWSADSKTFTSATFAPSKHVLGNPLIVRTRLDYGAALSGPGGEADWGEVEDDMVVNFVEDFDFSRHGELPYMGLGGWYLAPDAPPCVHYGIHEVAMADHPPAPEACTGAIESSIRTGTPLMDFTEYTEAHLSFFYCHDIQQPCGPFGMDDCHVEYKVGGATVATDPIPFGGGVFTKDISFLCGSKDIIIDFVSETDDQGFIGIDDVIVWAFDSESHSTMAAPTLVTAVNGSGETHGTVSWTAVDDNSSLDPTLDRVANNYEVRFSSTPITTADDYFASQPVTPMDVGGGAYLGTPGAPGTPESITFHMPTGFGASYASVLVGDEVQHVGGHVSSGAAPAVASTGVNTVSHNDTSGAAGDTVTLNFTITNTGNTLDIFELSPSASLTANWLFFLPDGGVDRTKLLLPLGPGAASPITMKVWIPFTSSSGDTNSVTLTATSINASATTSGDTGLVIVDPNTAVASSDGVTPIEVGLSVTGANPFRRNTHVRLALPEAQHGTIQVYNAAGRMVRTIVDGRIDAGIRDFTWDGKNDAGAPVSSGVYLMRFESEDVNETRRLVRLR